MWQCYVLFFTAITSCEKNQLPQFASPSLSAFLYPAMGIGIYPWHHMPLFLELKTSSWPKTSRRGI